MEERQRKMATIMATCVIEVIEKEEVQRLEKMKGNTMDSQRDAYSCYSTMAIAQKTS